MSDNQKRRVENVRLVRLPDGRLVPEKPAAKQVPTSIAPVNQTSQPPIVNNPKTETSQESQQVAAKSKKMSRRERRQQQADKDISDVWEEQMRLKEEAERLEMEYEVAKKMARELKRKVKERQQPLDYADSEFKDLLSPEVRDLGVKIKPAVNFTKDIVSGTWLSVRAGFKKFRVAARLLIKKFLGSKKALIITPVAICAVILLIGVGSLINKQLNNRHTAVVMSASDSSPNDGRVDSPPDFKPITPKNKDINSLTNRTRKTPNGSIIYSYKDTIGSNTIEVTEQKLPDNLKNPSELEKLTKSFNTAKQLEVDGNSVYTGKSGKGVQTVIFIKDDVLTFMTAPEPIKEIDLVQYISGLVKH